MGKDHFKNIRIIFHLPYERILEENLIVGIEGWDLS